MKSILLMTFPLILSKSTSVVPINKFSTWSLSHNVINTQRQYIPIDISNRNGESDFSPIELERMQKYTRSIRDASPSPTPPTFYRYLSKKHIIFNYTSPHITRNRLLN